MDDDTIEKRRARRRKIAERRRLREMQEVLTKPSPISGDLFIQLGIISLFIIIIVDFLTNFYPLLSGFELSLEISYVTFFLRHSALIMFGIALFFAGRKMSRDTGIFGGMLQIDSSICYMVGIIIYLIMNPLYYTIAEIQAQSILFGLQVVSSVLLLLFGLLVAFFFFLIGSNSQKYPLKYIVLVTGFLWLIQLFLPAFTPSPTADPTLYSIISSVIWITYGLTAYCFWKMVKTEDLVPSPTAPYRIK
ncbi:MAG: hypothetical protein ACTSRS_19155 [Candidatus Helarchaeota archaeon]